MMNSGPGVSAFDGFGGWVGSRVMILTTFKRDGAAVSTPVWFVPGDGRLTAVTHGGSGKLKRIRAGSQGDRATRVLVAPGTYRGAATGVAQEGAARILGPAESVAALAATRGRYGLLGRVLFFVSRLRGKALDTGIEIVPASG